MPANHSMMIVRLTGTRNIAVSSIDDTTRHEDEERPRRACSCSRWTRPTNYTHRQCNNYNYCTHLSRRERERWHEMRVSRVTHRGSGRLKLWLYRDLNQLLSHMLYKYGVILLQSLFWVFSGNIRFCPLDPKNEVVKKMCHPTHLNPKARTVWATGPISIQIFTKPVFWDKIVQ